LILNFLIPIIISVKHFLAPVSDLVGFQVGLGDLPGEPRFEPNGQPGRCSVCTNRCLEAGHWKTYKKLRNHPPLSVSLTQDSHP